MKLKTQNGHYSEPEIFVTDTHALLWYLTGIESWDYVGKNGKVWVKVQNIPFGSTTIIRIYYGNQIASTASNGDKTFEFFDDFENNNFKKWDLSTGWAISPLSYQADYSAYAAGIYHELEKSINMNKGIFEGSFKFTEINQYHYPYISPFDSSCGNGEPPYLLSTKPDGHFGYWPVPGIHDQNPDRELRHLRSQSHRNNGLHPSQL
ncbi:MAG: DUF2341 domain-containing protein [Candidatus Methanoperedens sp.]|nr:DUF2341 domain-containing protein [Candidatus Methanoperedens sp.]